MTKSLPRPRRVGVLYFWHISKSGGFGKVLIPSTRELFFLHRKLIIAGEPIVGSPVEFTPAPAAEGKIHPQAMHAVIDNSKRIHALDVLGDQSAPAPAVAILSGKAGAS